MEAILFDGVPRMLARLDPPMRMSAPPLTADYPLIPESQWRDIDDIDDFIPVIYDQGRQSSCVGNSLAQCANIAWKQQTNAARKFSPQFIYSWINGGQDAGAMISDGGEAMIKHGCAPLDMVPFDAIFTPQIPAKATSEALNLRVGKVYHLPTWEAFGTAIQRRWPVAFGIIVGNSFANVDGDGIAGVASQQDALGGHAICCVGGKKTSKGYAPRFVNSWGNSFGRNGTAFITRAHWDISQRMGLPADAIAIVGFADDPRQPPAPTAK